MGFDAINSAAQQFNEAVMGETCSYTAPNGGSTTSGLVGVFNQVEQQYEFADGSTRQTTSLVGILSKSQWGSVVPQDEGVITYGNTTYQIESLKGVSSAGEPAYELTCKKLT